MLAEKLVRKRKEIMVVNLGRVAKCMVDASQRTQDMGMLLQQPPHCGECTVCKCTVVSSKMKVEGGLQAQHTL